MENQNSNGQEIVKSTHIVLRDALAIGFRRRRLIRRVFLWSLLGALLAVLLVGIKYESNMNLMVRRSRMDPAVTPDISPRPQFPTDNNTTALEINSEIELLQSQDLLEKVVAACGLHIHWWTPYAEHLNPWLPGWKDVSFGSAVQALGTDLSLNAVKDSGVIQVSYSSGDPDQSACVVKTLQDAYMAKHLEVNRPPGLLNFFAEQTEAYRTKLADSQAKLLEFARRQNAVSAQTQVGLAVQQASTFESTLRTTQAAIAAAAERIRGLEAQLATTSPRVSTQMKKSDNSQLLATLKFTLSSLENQRSTLLTKYDSSYRLVQDVETQIAQTRAAIAAEEKNPVHEDTTDKNPTHQWLTDELAKARPDLRSLQAQAGEINRVVQSYRGEALLLDRKGITEQGLMREVKTAEENYLLYLAKREQARISDMLDTQRVLNVAIAEAATYPVVPIFSPTLLVGLAFLLGGFLSVGTAVTVDYLDPTLRTPDEVREFLDIPVYASIPENGHAAPLGLISANHKTRPTV